MRKNALSPRGFKQNKLFVVTAVVVLVALLLMIQQVAEQVVKAGTALGIDMPNVPALRVSASHVFMAGVGIILLLVAGLVVIPVAKFALIGAGLALLGYGVYNLYKLIQGQAVQDILPRK